MTTKMRTVFVLVIPIMLVAVMTTAVSAALLTGYYRVYMRDISAEEPRVQPPEGYSTKPERILVSTSCMDTDGGLKYYTSGTAIEINIRVASYCKNSLMMSEALCQKMPYFCTHAFLPPECLPKIKSDYCADSTTLIEAYCSSDNKANTKSHACPNSCIARRCVH